MKLFKLAVEYGLKNLPKDFVFSTITINYNLRCIPHKDGGNAGISCLTTLGNYEGGELVIEKTEWDIKHKPLIFNGGSCLHATAPFVGDRWSVVYYKIL